MSQVKVVFIVMVRADSCLKRLGGGGGGGDEAESTRKAETGKKLIFLAAGEKRKSIF